MMSEEMHYRMRQAVTLGIVIVATTLALLPLLSDINLAVRDYGLLAILTTYIIYDVWIGSQWRDIHELNTRVEDIYAELKGDE